MLNSIFTKSTLLFVIALFIVVSESNAQWSIGATYENKGEVPTNGFGLQLERDMKLPIPLIFIRTRAHASFFNETNNITSGNIQIDQEVSSYDFGVAAIAGANIALLSPYAGLGIGLEDYSINSDGDSFTPIENEVYYQAMVGLGLNLLPLIKPFVELRYSGFSNTDEISDSQQRLMFGVALRF
ncbi:MAG: hypothetical protein WD266_07410 [Balneolales bacterium]